jgi:hypothetical protein
MVSRRACVAKASAYADEGPVGGVVVEGMLGGELLVGVIADEEQ